MLRPCWEPGERASHFPLCLQVMGLQTPCFLGALALNSKYPWVLPSAASGLSPASSLAVTEPGAQEVGESGCSSLGISLWQRGIVSRSCK